jgi:hypothetical protein
MTVIVLQTFKAQEGRYRELADVIAGMLVDTAARKGAEFIGAGGDEAAGVVTIFQRWDNAENLQAYHAWRAADSGGVSKLAALLREAPKIEQLARVF